jgi:hypothetical protein
MRADGFTLIEILLAAGLMALFAATAAPALRGLLRKSGGASDESVRAAVTLLARDVRSAYLSPDDPRTRFVLRRENGASRLDFVRAAGLGDDPSPVVCGYVVTTEADGRHALWRRISGDLDGNFLEGGRRSFLCGDVVRFDIRAFDGTEWRDVLGWDARRQAPTAGVRGLPLAVTVRLSAGPASDPVDVAETVPLMAPLLRRAIHG